MSGIVAPIWLVFKSSIGSWYSNSAACLKCCAVPLFAYLGTGQACPVENEFIEITAGKHTLTVELAANPISRTCGLAFRADLPPDHGMLFVYSQDRILSFWMRNTFIPLSVAFLDGDGRILEMHDMDPHDSSRPYISKLLARYALEVNKGWFTAHGIEVGDRIEFASQAHRRLDQSHPQ